MSPPAEHEPEPQEPFCNPFATRYVRPGELEFLFPEQASAEQLLQQLAAAGWWGQILGPHGSGKSTLLASLLRGLPSGMEPLAYTLRQGQRTLRLPRMPRPGLSPNVRTLLVIDGFEQLTRWQRWRIARSCRSRRWGLLVTTHRDAGLPLLIQTMPQEGLAVGVVAQLLGRPLTADESAQAIDSFRQQGGNVREMLFDLYDAFERGRFGVVDRPGSE